MKRVRITVPVTAENKGDTRALIFPAPHPWWETGEVSGANFEKTAATIVAYTPDEDPLKYINSLWPEITSLEQFDFIQDNVVVEYSGRFPKPDTHDERGMLIVVSEPVVSLLPKLTQVLINKFSN